MRRPFVLDDLRNIDLSSMKINRFFAKHKYVLVMMSSNTLEYIKYHLNDDPTRLCLQSNKMEDPDFRAAVEQIAIRKQIKNKLPEWYGNLDLVFPSGIAAEQCSSELTAKYKQRFVNGGTIMDITGGMGVDLYYMSKGTKSAVYIEKFDKYCEAAEWNFNTLHSSNICIVKADSTTFLPQWEEPLELIYADPARRNEYNRRVYALEECEPNIFSCKDLLLRKAKYVLIKVSPMADIKHLLALLPEIKEVHILSVRNECKEVLLLLSNNTNLSAPLIYCVNLDTEEKPFVFCYSEEDVLPLLCSSPAEYLYEPNTSILKSGAFKSISESYGVKQLHPNSHLYTSNHLISDFPGRIFTVTGVFPLGGKKKKKIARLFPKANLSCRNFPLDVKQLRKQIGIKDGGDVYLFATTLEQDEKVVIATKKYLLR